MRAPRAALAALAIFLAIGTAGCAIMAAQAAKTVGDTVGNIKLHNNLNSHAVRSIKTLQIDRIAVMPLIDAAPDQTEGVAAGGAEAVSAELYSQAAIAGGWEVIPQDDVMTAMQKLPPSTPANDDENALKLGHDIAADGVLYGTLSRYTERVGADYAASSPASVNFNLKFVDMKSGQVVWTATFIKTQQALSENMFDFANFVQRSGRWVRAHEIAQEGVQEAVNDLHGKLSLDKNVKRFETGTYGQLKSSSQRYSTGSQGIY
ncbi:MAG TPA: hypothetical protein VMA09_17645 [Candidatus Binataceae bacterium]|nr:hypothetical protein [Candidatus Binataceae bacterium]